MADAPSPLQITRPTDARQVLGRWVRLLRQRQALTQGMLASRSGVPGTTLSRLEREGEGGLDSWLRVLQALGELDRFNDFLQERLRMAAIPESLEAMDRPRPERQRVRPKRPRLDRP